MVYDGATTVGDISLNQGVLAGTNLLSNLVEVLARFRLSKCAFTADFFKCFFQVAMPKEQRDLFRVIWLKTTIWSMENSSVSFYEIRLGY